MPVYDLYCEPCDKKVLNCIARMEDRNAVPCARCGKPMLLQLSAPRFRMWGQITPGGGPDKFTADLLGIPLKDLPEGLKA